jgi:hypothetical protein
MLQEWRKIEYNKSGKHGYPEGRTGHSALCLGYGGEQPQLLVIGGRNDSREVLNDAWIFDLTSRTWSKVLIPQQSNQGQNYSE